MSADLIEGLWRLSLALSASLALALALRLPWRRAFGARAVMMLWTLVPLSLLTAVLPAPVEWISVRSSPPMPASATSIVPSLTVEIPDSSASAGEMLVALWLSGALLWGCALWRQQRRFMTSLGTLRHWRGYTYFSSTAAHGPALIGLWRPRIVLPADFASRYSAEQQALVLAHEYAHLLRHDLWVTWLACVVRVGFWFHPLAHLGSRCLRLDQELACDEAVIEQSPQARREYATAILNTQLTDLGLPVGCFWQSSQPVRTRIVMISNSHEQLLPRKLGYAFGLALAALGLPLAWASQPAEVRIVSVVSPQPAMSSAFASSVASRGLQTAHAESARVRSPLDPSRIPRRELPVEASPLSLDAALDWNDSRPELTLAMAQHSSADVAPSAIVTDWVPPKLVKSRNPKWPPFTWASAAHTDGGQVLVGATIDTAGRPTELKIVQSSDRRFNLYALWAVEKFRFEPARRSGNAVSAYVELPLVWEERDRFIYEVIDPVGPSKHRSGPKDTYRRSHR